MTRTKTITEKLKTLASILILTALIPCDLLGQGASLTGVARDGDQTNLIWEGGEPPFQVQSSVNLTDWQDRGSPTEASEASVSSDDAVQFFRVLSSISVTNLGEYIGQLRVAEGEFGTHLARHRLKSIWDFYAPEGMPLERTAARFFETALVKLEILEGDVRSIYTSRLGDLPNAELAVTDRTIRVNWSTGTDAELRNYTLNLAFRYNTAQARQAINLSDPTYTFSCRYAGPQFDIDRAGESVTTRSDEVELVEIADNSNTPAWWRRKLGVEKGDISVTSQFEIGVPNIEGGPAFIFKTPLLTQWTRTQVLGLTSEPLELVSRFSQSYYPFHHNFVETLYLEPALEPGIDASLLTELREMNIRFIVPTQPSAFPEQESTLRVIGFDGVIREL